LLVLMKAILRPSSSNASRYSSSTWCGGKGGWDTSNLTL
jgi:hypothetical protein